MFTTTLLLWPLGAPAQEIRLGVEFQVNSYTTDYQRFSAVAASGSGDFVVAWNSFTQDGSASGVFARRFSSAGAPLAAEFQVNSYTTSFQRYPAVAASGSGDFVVAWESYTLDGSGHGVFGVFARRFSSAGDPLAAELQVSSYATSNQRHPAVAASGSGDFVVAWHGNTQDGSNYGVLARRFSSAGDPLAAEFQVNSYTTGSQWFPTVAASGSGDFVVAWMSYTQDGSSDGVFARRFSSAGDPTAAEFQVNSYTTDTQRFPAVAASGSGDFVVAWPSNTQDGSSYGVFARRFSSTGDPLAAEFQVNSYSTSLQRSPAVAASGSGDFVVAWQSYTQDGSSDGVFARRFSSTGDPLAAEFQVNSYTTIPQRYPAVAASASGDFVIAWDSDTQDGSGIGIFAQRFARSAILDIDGNGQLGALTDGLLVLRYLFGFTGATLVSSAIDLVGCTRCPANEIEAYLSAAAAGPPAILDIDGNGQLGALTDGLLVLRYLFGFTGAPLVSSAVDLVGCTRCPANEIEAYLQTLI